MIELPSSPLSASYSSSSSSSALPAFVPTKSIRHLYLLESSHSSSIVVQALIWRLMKCTRISEIRDNDNFHVPVLLGRLSLLFFLDSLQLFFRDEEKGKGGAGVSHYFSSSRTEHT